MPAAPPPEERDLVQLRAAQRQRNTPRIGSDFLKSIDDVLKENESIDLSGSKKAKNIAEIERTFPGVEEDEKTPSGMYEPALHNFPLDENVYRPSRPDSDPTNEYRSDVLTPDQIKRMFPKSASPDYKKGTGPKDTFPRMREERQRQVDDADPNTPDYGTEREERDYAGFEANTTNYYNQDDNIIGSEGYWNQIDNHTLLRRERYAYSIAHSNSRTNINTSGTGTRAIRRSRNPEAGPVRDTRTSAYLMSQGSPARAGGVRSGTHSFRGRAEPAYAAGRLPRQLSPGLRNVETDYTVYSYNTPIAWRSTEGHWEIPRINYSRTTQRHQNAIRNALRNSYHSPLAEASSRISGLRQTHREQGINLPRSKYELNVGFETYHREPPSNDIIDRVVQDHLQNVINPAIAEHRNTPSFQRRQRQMNATQLPLEGGAV